MRDCLDYFIQQCPHCGYSHHDLSQAIDESKSVIQRPEYQSLLVAPHVPETARSYMASSFLYEQQRQFAKATWDMISAAWICDDEKKDDIASFCRVQAISLLNNANAYQQSIAEQPSLAQLIKIDLLRRANLFDLGLTELAQLSDKKMEPLLKQTAAFQLDRCLAHDNAAYNFADVTSTH
ncbi:hypothetical protein [Motilimonas pumila]|nr:hypothetical protein [Motilimonas pumila]